MTDIASQLEAAHRKIAELESQLAQHENSRVVDSRSYYQALFEDNHVTMLLIDPDSGAILNANEAASDFYGWSCEELTSKSIFDLNTLTNDEIRQEMQRASLLQKRYFDFSHRVAGGGVREVEVYSGPLNYNGSAALYSCIFDVTERKRAERAIVESENKLRLLFNTANDAIFVHPDQPGNFSEINSVAGRWLGYSREEILTLQPADVLSHQSLSNWNQAVAQLAEAGKAVFEVVFTSRTGARIPAEVSSVLFFKGEVRQVISVARDISNRERVGRALFQAREAKADSRAKSKFLANISHELRTPVNGIFGMLQLIQATPPLTHEQADYISQAMTSCRRLADLLHNILDTSCIEAGNLKCEKEKFSLRESIHFINELFALSAKQKRLEYSGQVDESLPEFLYGDKIRIEQILANLVGNSIKFTEQGGVTLKVDLLPATHTIPSHRVQVLITVTDTGIGIPANMMEKVFKPFRQVDSALTRRYQGAGLGLSIVKQLLLLMGGTACVVSAPDKGTKFYLSLPLFLQGDQCEAVATPAVSDEISSRPGKVLVVEDDNISRRVLLGMLQNIGVEAESAKNGAEALRLLERVEFSLILMDIQMPVMDGLEATRAIRNSEKYTGNADIPIIGITAHARAADKKQAMDTGMNGCLSKPLKVNELKKVLLSCRGKNRVSSLAVESI